MGEEYFVKEIQDNCHDYLKPMYIESWAPKEYKDLFYTIANYIPKLNICTEMTFPDYGLAVICDQHAMIFGQASGTKPILATCALNACVSLIIYCPTKKVGVVSHFDGLPGYHQNSAKFAGLDPGFDPVKLNVSMMLRKINSHGLLDIYLVGGVYGLSETMVQDILAFILTLPNIQLKGRNLMGPVNQSRNVALDTRDGTIKYFDIIENSTWQHQNQASDNRPKALNKHPALLDITWDEIY